MDSNTSVLYAAAGLPALVSTGITILYFFLKLCNFAIHAISNKAKRRVATPMTSGSEQAHCTNLREESDPEIHQQVQRHFFRRHPRWRKDTGILRDRTFIKMGANHMPPFLYTCCREYNRVPFLRKRRKTVPQRASRYRRK